MIGQTISHSRIVETFDGRSVQGMELGRFVDLKFLPDDVPKDPQALSRFYSEGNVADCGSATQIRFHFHASYSGFTRLKSYGRMAEVMKPFRGALKYESHCPWLFRYPIAIAFTTCSGPTANST
jgi:hypothetical protein